MFKPWMGALLLWGMCWQTGAQPDRTRLVIMADMGCEHDEMQQNVHAMICSNEFEPELLMAVTGTFIHPGMRDEYRRVTHPELLHEIVDAYEKVYPNLQKHASGWHTPEYLRSIICTGQPDYGIAGVGDGKSSEGSTRLIELFEEDDPRPIWIAVNAGSSTLAQALHDYAASHSEEELHAVIKKLRVFENGAQDNAGSFICKTYPDIHWIRSNYQTYAYGGPGSPRGTDIATIGPSFWGDYAHNARGQHDWLQEHVIQGHGPLGAVYPERRFGKNVGFMEGGGTIPWIGLANRGLFSTEHPSWGGWGGRYTADKVQNVMSRHKSVSADDEKQVPYFMYSDDEDHWLNPADGTVWDARFAPVWRWREAMYNDFICRMDWCTQPFEKANHHPKAAFGDDRSDSIVFLNAKPGDKVELDASKSSDPDRDELEFLWWVYPEAGTYAGDVQVSDPAKAKTHMIIPTDAAGKQVHLVLQTRDNNRIASLYDYRRIVIDVSN